MAAGDVATVIRAPGRVVVGCDQPFHNGVYPYGGTEVGKTKLCMLTPLGTPFEVHYESIGEIGDVLEPSKNYVFTCFVRAWDTSAVQLLRSPGYAAGDVSQRAVFSEPGNKVPGQSAYGRGVVIAYVPDDPIHVPGLVIYHGIADWTEGSEIAFQRDSELGIPLTVRCLRDTSGRILKLGILADTALGANNGTISASLPIPTMSFTGTS